MSVAYQAYRRAAESRDREAMLALMANEVRMHGPARLTPSAGKAQVGLLCGQLLDIRSDLAFTEVCTGKKVATLFFRCRIDGKVAEGCDVLHFDDAGLIEDLRVMVRPLNALVALGETIARRGNGQIV